MFGLNVELDEKILYFYIFKVIFEIFFWYEMFELIGCDLVDILEGLGRIWKFSGKKIFLKGEV